MNPHHISAQQERLETLSYPGLGQRLVESVIGSVRRDGLSILRAASHPELETGKDLSSLSFRHADGEVRFICNKGLEAVHVTTERDSLHLSGSCEMAQRLARFATRALGAHHARAKSACVDDALRLLSGADHGQALCSSYEAFPRNQHHGDGYDCGNVEKGSITTKHGVLTLRSAKRIFRVGGELGQQMDLDRNLAISAMERDRVFSTSYPGGMVAGSAMNRERYPLPPPAAGEIDSAEATFSNPKLEAMLKLLDSHERLGEVDLSRHTVRSLLAWAKKMQTRQ